MGATFKPLPEAGRVTLTLSNLSGASLLGTTVGAYAVQNGLATELDTTPGADIGGTMTFSNVSLASLSPGDLTLEFIADRATNPVAVDLTGSGDYQATGVIVDLGALPVP